MAPRGAARSSPPECAKTGSLRPVPDRPLPCQTGNLEFRRRLTPDIPVIHRQNRAVCLCANRIRPAWSGFAVRDGLPATEESFDPRPPRKRAVSFGTQATEAVDGFSKEKCEASADPNFFEGPAEPEPSGSRTAKGKPSGFAPTETRIGFLRESDWEPTEVARPRPEPERAPVEACFDGTSPTRPGKTPALTGDAVGPGTSGGWWQHQLPFCFWASPRAARSRHRAGIRGVQP